MHLERYDDLLIKDHVRSMVYVKNAGFTVGCLRRKEKKINKSEFKQFSKCHCSSIEALTEQVVCLRRLITLLFGSSEP